jgi:uncharacterized Ntn-hydrolase superfamily protein
MSFLVASAVKYLWRVDDKDNPYQDLEKAVWCIKREIQRRKKMENGKKEKIHNKAKS